MANLAQLLATHGRILVLDAASARVQVGLLRAGHDPVWQTSATESGQSLFTCTAACLAAAKLTLHDVAAFAFCEGPGSMLGVRTAVMAIRTWQAELPRPAYRYQSLAVAGAYELGQKPPRAFTVIADARRETWHSQSVDAEGGQPMLRRIPPSDMPSGELMIPENFRTWSQLPATVTTCSYDLAKIFPVIATGDFFHASTAPDAFQHEPPDYKKWSAHTHSAATAPSR